jgi:hypothetical protein
VNALANQLAAERALGAPRAGHKELHRPRT